MHNSMEQKQRCFLSATCISVSLFCITIMKYLSLSKIIKNRSLPISPFLLLKGPSVDSLYASDIWRCLRRWRDRIYVRYGSLPFLTKPIMRLCPLGQIKSQPPPYKSLTSRCFQINLRGSIFSICISGGHMQRPYSKRSKEAIAGNVILNYTGSRESRLSPSYRWTVFQPPWLKIITQRLYYLQYCLADW